MYYAAEENGLDPSSVEIVQVDLPKGGAAIHHMNLWHGSGKNNHPSLPRKVPTNNNNIILIIKIKTIKKNNKKTKAVAIHTIPSHTKFKESGVHYTYGRYKRFRDQTMDENFFPITWTKKGYRSEFLSYYVKDHIQLTFDIPKQK